MLISTKLNRSHNPFSYVDFSEMSRYIPEPPLGQTMDSRAFQAALDASPDAKYLLAKVKTNKIFFANQI